MAQLLNYTVYCVTNGFCRKDTYRFVSLQMFVKKIHFLWSWETAKGISGKRCKKICTLVIMNMSFTATDHHWCRRGRQLQQFHILHYSIINLLIHLPQQLNKVLSIIYLCSKFIHFRDKSFIFSLQCFIDKLQLLQRATKINILHYCYHNYNIVTKLKLPTSLHQVCQCYQQFFYNGHTYCCKNYHTKHKAAQKTV